MDAGRHAAPQQVGELEIDRSRRPVRRACADPVHLTATADLEAADTSRRELIANVSHQLRTPISALRAVLENVVDGVATPDPATLRVALAQTDRLGRLVGELLDLSRIDAGGEPLTFASTVHPHGARFFADEARLLQVRQHPPEELVSDITAPAPTAIPGRTTGACPQLRARRHGAGGRRRDRRWGYVAGVTGWNLGRSRAGQVLADVEVRPGQSC